MCIIILNCSMYRNIMYAFACTPLWYKNVLYHYTYLRLTTIAYSHEDWDTLNVIYNTVDHVFLAGWKLSEIEISDVLAFKKYL